MVLLIMSHHKGKNFQLKTVNLQQTGPFLQLCALCMWPVWGPEKPGLWIWSSTCSYNVALAATKADESPRINTSHTKNNNGVHKHHLEALTRHWGAGRQRSIAAELAHCGEVKRCLMNRKPYWQEPYNGRIVGLPSTLWVPALGEMMRKSPP